MSQSDSDDLFGDDDAFFEQKKQELLKQQSQQQQQHNPNVDPDFLAQFDPSSPTYHGGGDNRPVPLGGQRLPDSLAAQYGNINWKDLPIVEEKEEPPETYGQAYATLFRRRQSLIQFKKLFVCWWTFFTSVVSYTGLSWLWMFMFTLPTSYWIYYRGCYWVQPTPSSFIYICRIPLTILTDVSVLCVFCITPSPILFYFFHALTL